MQVVESDGGRAMSTNGIVWDIHVRVDDEEEWGANTRYSKQPLYYRYGLWSFEEGLASRPPTSQYGNDSMAEKCNVLIDAIIEHLMELPFRLEDNIELWLFDKNGTHPLTLLAAVTSDSPRPSPEPRYWSACLGAEGVPSQRRFPAVKQLETLVAERASFNIKSAWVIRQEEGSGMIENSGKVLNADVFPPYLIAEDWLQTEHSELVNSYIQWIAPSLLTLQHLSRDQRLHLERCLTVQAISIEHHWHLYPQIIDMQYIKAARVQCRIEKANM